MKTIKLLSLLLTVCLLLIWIPVTASADEVASGTIHGISWALHTDGTLVVSGSGYMVFDTDYISPGYAPWYEYRDLVTSLIIEEGVSSITFSAFADCSNLTTVSLPNSLQEIHFYAFSNCVNLSNINIPVNVRSIEDSVFMGCTSLRGIWIDENNQYYNNDAFGVLFNTDYTDLIAAPGALSGTYVVPDTVCQIESNAFAHNGNLSNIIIPDSVIEMGMNVFLDCTSLTEVVLPNSIKDLPYGLFGGCTSLRTVVLPENIKYIAMWMFDHCTSLTEIEIPENVVNIERYAFLRCDSLEEIIIPDTVETIEFGAFMSCKNLKTVHIPASVTVIEEDNFVCGENLDGIWVDEENQYYCNDESGVLFSKDKTILKAAPSSIGGNYMIPGEVTNIETYAFYSCENLTGIAIPANIELIGFYAFADCEKLDTVIFRGAAPVIESSYRGDYAFSGVTATVYYPQNDESWTVDIMKDYGGKLTWIAYEPDNEPIFHEHAYNTIVVEPTCTTEGYTTYTCTECGDSYVDDYTDALDHSYEAVVTAPTYEAQGYTTYTCTVCGYSYEGDFVPALVYHEVLEGEDAQWSPESGEPVSVHVDADIANFVEVLLNGQVLDEEYYTLTEGSTIVTLKPEYLATLPTGEHTLELIFTDGSAEVTFEILAPAVTLGDVNGDGEIDILDANLVVAWYNEIRDLDEESLAAADVNGDGEVDIMDANMIVAYYNEVIDAFPKK